MAEMKPLDEPLSRELLSEKLTILVSEQATNYYGNMAAYFIILLRLSPDNLLIKGRVLPLNGLTKQFTNAPS